MLKELLGQWLLGIGSGIEHHEGARVLGQAGCLDKGWQGGLKLHEKDGCLADVGGCLENILGREESIGTAGHDNGVLAMGVNGDGGHTGGYAGGELDVAKNNTLFAQHSESGFAKSVTTEAGNEDSLAAKTCHGNCLVGSLAALSGHEVGADNGLACLGEMVDTYDEIGIAAADYYDCVATL